MGDFSDQPTVNMPPPLLSILSPDQQYAWLAEQAKRIRTSLTQQEQRQTIQDDLDAEDAHHTLIASWKDENDRYSCPDCRKSYVRVTALEKHRLKVHDIEQPGIPNENAGVSDPLVPTLVDLLFLQHDTVDLFKYGDGNRSFRNAKVEFLYMFACKHTKYWLWHWRMLAYQMALLSERKAAEYKWNLCVNTTGGIGRCIPNDNFVECQVKNIKQTLQHQGPNKSYETAKIACQTTQVLQAIKEAVGDEAVRRRRKKSPVDVTEDIRAISKAVASAAGNPSETFEGFENFRNPIYCIKPVELHKWIKNQKEVAAHYMM
jgi:hypothetical protein